MASAVPALHEHAGEAASPERALAPDLAVVPVAGGPIGHPGPPRRAPARARICAPPHKTGRLENAFTGSLNDTPFGNGKPATQAAVQPFEISTASVMMDFKPGVTNKDTVSIAGTLFIPGTVDPAGAVVKIHFGQIVATYILDAQGIAAPAPNNTFRLHCKFGTNNSARIGKQLYRFQWKLPPGAYADLLTNYASAEGTARTRVNVPITILYNGTFGYQRTLELYYKAKPAPTYSSSGTMGGTLQLGVSNLPDSSNLSISLGGTQLLGGALLLAPSDTIIVPTINSSPQ